MGSRYLITGVQLGMIGAFASIQNNANQEPIKKLLDEIIENQWIGYSGNSIQKDVSNCQLTTALLKEKS